MKNFNSLTSLIKIRANLRNSWLERHLLIERPNYLLRRCHMGCQFRIEMAQLITYKNRVVGNSKSPVANCLLPIPERNSE